MSISGWMRGIILAMVSIASAASQSIIIKGVLFERERLVIHYDLEDSVQGRSYSIKVYSSVDGYLNPLGKISGDTGLDVKVGKDKVIEWSALEELPAQHNGKVALEIRGKVFIPFIGTQSINQYKVFKRSREYNLTWTGGSPQNILNFDLYHGEKKIYTFPNLANVGHHAFVFPSHIKPGGSYTLRISDAKNKDEVVFTEKFKIKRKIPLLLKALPAALIAYGAYTIASKASSPAEPDLGDPHLPPQR